MEGKRALLVMSLASTSDLALSEELDFVKIDSARTELLTIGVVINELIHRDVGVGNTHGNAFRTSATTASCNLALISSKLCSSLTCISACLSLMVP